MALVTISGLPCSGKTTRAHELAEILESSQPLAVSIINDESLGLTKASYDDARVEKQARGTLTGELQRTMRSDRMVICDALNYIKGFRYQLYVLAREMGCRVVTVHVAAPPERCREWNAARPETQRYKPSTMDELIMRYEEPDFATRWDTPLVVVPFSDEAVARQPILDAVLHGTVKPPTPAAAPRVQSTTDYLRLIDTAAASVIAGLLQAQGFSPGGPWTFKVDGASVTVDGPGDGRPLSAPTLQRHKRAFVALLKQAGGRAEYDAPRLVEMFVAYLNDQLR